MSEKITITYYVADGYAGKDRPKYATAYVSDFEDCETDDAIIELAQQAVDDHFAQNVFPEINDDEALVAKVRSVLAKSAGAK